MAELKVIVIKCPGCGSPLKITDDVEHFACGSCGNELFAERKGGIVALKPVVAAIEKVQKGADKTAAELAIVRLNKELEELRTRQTNIEHSWEVTKIKKSIADARFFTADSVFSRHGCLASLYVYVSLPVFGLLGYLLIGPRAGNLDQLVIIGVFLFVCWVCGAFLVRNAIIRSLKRKLEETLAKSKPELTQLRSQIIDTQRKIQENTRIANI